MSKVTLLVFHLSARDGEVKGYVSASGVHVTFNGPGRSLAGGSPHGIHSMTTRVCRGTILITLQ